MSITAKVVGVARRRATQAAVANAVTLACSLLCVSYRRITWDPDLHLFRIIGLRAGRAFDLSMTAEELVTAINRSAPPAPPPG
jgi:hypothetical protein